ncbi:protein STPG4-like [Watersipora subatra]|uniref:protein STPG4-like n=1 Tax=Watersipora subatra TaxID=2589382 RepID=UPI00355BC837
MAAVAPALNSMQESKTLDIARPTIIQTRRKKPTEKVRIPIYDRNYKGANTQIRTGLADEYEGEKSGRESWWRTYIRETPLPSAYGVEEADTFILDLEKSQKTYSFKSDGRKLEVTKGGKGEALMPGAYNFKQFSEMMAPMTYRFKNTGREGRDVLNEGIIDKDIKVAPNQYETLKYGCTTVNDPNNKNYTFKSTSKRFPTVYFTPKDGPAPGQYNAKPQTCIPVISSSFKSSTPRFKTSHTRVPGPGMYESTYQSRPIKTLTKMGRVHGLFFSCSFQK